MHQQFSIEDVVPAIVKTAERYDNPSLRYCRARDLLWQAACRLDNVNPEAKFVALSKPVRAWYDRCLVEITRLLGTPF